MKAALWLVTTAVVAVPFVHAQTSVTLPPGTHLPQGFYVPKNPAAEAAKLPSAPKFAFDQPGQAPVPATYPQQTSLPAPAAPPQEFEMPANGQCQGVRSGDLVHFTLKIDSVQDARAIFTNLELSLGHVKYHAADLALRGNNTLGGGGAAIHDATDPVLYHFSFIVPDDVRPGIYRTFGIAVRADYGAVPGDPLRPVDVPLNRSARKEVQRYCLAVFGGGNGGRGPIVTEFKPGPVERATALPPPVLPSKSRQ